MKNVTKVPDPFVTCTRTSTRTSNDHAPDKLPDKLPDKFKTGNQYVKSLVMLVGTNELSVKEMLCGLQKIGTPWVPTHLSAKKALR